MNKQTIRDIAVAGKRVLVRVDFNVPLDGTRITDDTRIRAALPTINALRAAGARVVLLSHLGRPKGTVVAALRLAPVAARLSELLGTAVATGGACIGPAAEAVVAGLRPGEVALLENVRFHPEKSATIRPLPVRSPNWVTSTSTMPLARPTAPMPRRRVLPTCFRPSRASCWSAS